MNYPEILFVGLGAAVWLTTRFVSARVPTKSRRAKSVSELRSWPQRTIESARPNEAARFYGRLEGANTLRGPYSDDPCLGWYLSAELRDARRLGIGRLEPCLLRDPWSQAKVSQSEDFRVEGGAEHPVPREQLAKFAPMFGVAEPEIASIVERCIRDGDRVAIVGIPEWEARAGVDYRSVVRRVRFGTEVTVFVRDHR